jgi:hypothetical protein
MKKALWDLQAIPGTLSQVKDPAQVKEIFEREFFDLAGSKLRPKRLKDTEGNIVIPTERNFKHIFFKNGLFLVERAERVYWIKATILNSRYIVNDKDNNRRFHYLQPYSVSGCIESFCVITERTDKDTVSRIITAFPVDWERVYAFVQQKINEP